MLVQHQVESKTLLRRWQEYLRASYERPSENCLTVPKSWTTSPFWCGHGWLPLT
ncbi:hypothetical protein JRC61_08940 [Streptomyces sp. CL12-4]|nr:hypothetical protein [Streptomyces sp. CL12-4]